MKLTIWIPLAFAAVFAQAAERKPEFSAARDYYQAAEFRKAAAGFRVLCDTDNDAEACYWAGTSYERLGDTRIPFGRRTYAKAHEYFSKAARLEPNRAEYRDGLFNFLLNTADCSRSSLREASMMLSVMPESDPDRFEMTRRLREEARLNRSADARLARLFLLVPRVSYDAAAVPAALVAPK